MSFDGVRIDYGKSDNCDVKPKEAAPTERQKFQRAFALFQRRRKTQWAQLSLAGDDSQLGVCSCGHRKNQSASYCAACTDARHILKQKFTVRDQSGRRREERERTVYSLPDKRVPDKISMAAGGDDNLDRLVNLYEQALTNYG